MIIQRPIYLKRLIDRQHNGMIKIITGMRRSGKSYLLFSLYAEYLQTQGVTPSHIIKIDLENITNDHLRDPLTLIEYIHQQITDSKEYYVLIDEVQHLRRFEDALNTLLKNSQLDVYVTGSNARFLSKDVVTTFRGRGDEEARGRPGEEGRRAEKGPEDRHHRPRNKCQGSGVLLHTNCRLRA
mgnify:CR=1 FL=1